MDNNYNTESSQPDRPTSRGSNQYAKRFNELSALVPEETLLNGQKFDDLTLYEQKSVLVNYELE
jgi:hypothetical protein